MWVVKNLKGYKKIKKKAPLILTLGTFDGLHLGHQHVLSLVKKRARIRKGIPVVFTFENHPLSILKKKKAPCFITSTQHRLHLLSDFGIEGCFLVDFTNKFSVYSPEDFVKKVLVEQLNVDEVVLGYDSRFGKNRKGTSELMKDLAKKYQFRFFQAEHKKYRNETMSSSIVRDFIQKGHLSKASRLLGRSYSILGEVVKGRGLGKKLGFPTANLNPHSEALPPRGVYLVRLDILDMGLKKTANTAKLLLKDKIIKEQLWGLLNIGFRPTVDKKKKIIPELHILNFKGSLYGRTIEVTFVKKIRNEKKFGSVDLLQKQIKKDVISVDKYIHCS